MCLLPQAAFAAVGPGQDLRVRVGYEGQYQEYQTIKTLSLSDLSALPQETNYYYNVTNVGTVMATVGSGPTVADVINAAGIDVNSAKTINFCTTDGQGDNKHFISFPASAYIGGTRYCYPNLLSNWKNVSMNSGIPLAGALDGAKPVDTILAITSYTQKSRDVNPGQMNSVYSYRLCVGQTPLKENMATTPANVTSNQLAYWIFGIDVTLKGSPVKGLTLNVKDSNVKVGSSAEISVNLQADKLFRNKILSTLTWKSSNTSIATVNAQGIVTIKKKGAVTITAKTADGTTASILINGTGKDKGKKAGPVVANKTAPPKTPDKKPVIKKVGTMTAKEILIGANLNATDYGNNGTSNVVAPLPEQKESPIAILAAAYTAIIIFCGALILRILQYFKEV